jgi:hypothetical protein
VALVLTLPKPNPVGGKLPAKAIVRERARLLALANRAVKVVRIFRHLIPPAVTRRRGLQVLHRGVEDMKERVPSLRNLLTNGLGTARAGTKGKRENIIHLRQKLQAVTVPRPSRWFRR